LLGMGLGWKDGETEEKHHAAEQEASHPIRTKDQRMSQQRNLIPPSGTFSSKRAGEGTASRDPQIFVYCGRSQSSPFSAPTCVEKVPEGGMRFLFHLHVITSGCANIAPKSVGASGFQSCGLSASMVRVFSISSSLIRGFRSIAQSAGREPSSFGGFSGL
jgi:hypothetical protein